jgi:hypothetical protein
MKRKGTPARALLALTLSLGAALGLCFQKITALQLTKSTSRPKIEKLLGKPVKSVTEGEAKIASYKLEGTLGVKVVYLGSGDAEGDVESFLIAFDRKTKWTAVTKLLGMNPATMTPSKMKHDQTTYQLIGDPIKDWNVYYTVADAKDRSGKLQQSEGLPYLTIEVRSFNDDSPD